MHNNCPALSETLKSSQLVLCNSGIKSVPAIYIRFPAAKGTRNIVAAPELPSIIPNTAPSIDVNAVKKLNISALNLENPPYTSTPKFPNSWGISWNATAIVVATPAGMLMKYDPAITSPSIKLCMASPIKFMYAKW